MSENQENYEVEQWGVVELMGHKVVAGKISKSEMLGKPMLRVDVPQVGDIPAFTQLYGESAIYCVTFVSQQYAEQAAAATRAQPVLVYELRRMLETHGTEPMDGEPDPADEYDPGAEMEDDDEEEF